MHNEEKIKCAYILCKKEFFKYKAVKVYLNYKDQISVVQYLCPYCDKVILGETDIVYLKNI